MTVYVEGTNFKVKPGVVAISGIVASHFCADQIGAEEIKDAYDRCGMILGNPSRFPKADTAYLCELEDALFEQAPTACTLGI